jgi:hypothetical protein
MEWACILKPFFGNHPFSIFRLNILEKTPPLVGKPLDIP